MHHFGQLKRNTRHTLSSRLTLSVSWIFPVFSRKAELSLVCFDFLLQGHFFLCSFSVGPAEGGLELHRSDSGRCRLTSLTQALKQISILRVGNSRHTSEDGCPRSRWRFGDSWLAYKWPQFCIFLISLYGEGWREDGELEGEEGELLISRPTRTCMPRSR